MKKIKANKTKDTTTPKHNKKTKMEVLIRPIIQPCPLSFG
jgi:hypothetical protein